MSRSTLISMTFWRPLTVTGLVGFLADSHGWSPVEPLGVSYMLEGDDDWEWTSVEPDQAADVMLRLDAAELRDTHVAMAVYHPESATGGHLLFSPGRTKVVFSPVINRREILGAPDMTDMAWYIEHLVYPLLDEGLSGYQLRDTVD